MTKVRRRAILALLKRLSDVLSGEDGRMWFKALKKFLRKEDPWSELTVRWTVTLGVYKTPEAYREALKSKNALGVFVNQWTPGLLDKFICSKKQVKIHLTDASFEEVGLVNGGTLGDFLAAVRPLGGTKCPAEVGPALCLQDENLPLHKNLLILMDWTPGFNNQLDLFFLCKGNDHTVLHTLYGHITPHFFPASTRVVFVVKHK